MGCDYTDVVKVLDYTPEAFEYANRKSYHKWRLIGMQVSHTFVGGVRLADPASNLQATGVNISGMGEEEKSGQFITYNTGLTGMITGCIVLEEINQNNQLINRGANYLRAKVDGDGNNSATYGIIGNCRNPDKKRFGDSSYDEVAVTKLTGGGEADSPWGLFEGLEQEPFIPTTINKDLEGRPMLNGWADPQDYYLCCCPTSENWEMRIRIEIDDGGKKKYFMQNPIYATPDGNGKKMPNSVDYGTFNQYYGDGRGNRWYYRTCEAISYPLGGIGEGTKRQRDSVSTKLCVDYSDPIYNIGYSGKGDGLMFNGPVELQNVTQGVFVKLTSLPSCKHFNQTINFRIPSGQFPDTPVGREKQDRCYDPNEYGYDPDHPMCFERNRKERAVIRIMPACMAVAGTQGRFGGEKAYQRKYFDVLEVHYDRWDKAPGPGNNFKIFDEVYSFPAQKMRVRVIAHGKKYLDQYEKDFPYQIISNIDNIGTIVPGPGFMEPYFLTGGSVTDRAGGAKGCSCVNAQQSPNSYPIRPYNQFTYCPNDFSGEKSCK
jgi:hypothetical protein